jgi:hypothetical protein
MNKNIIKRIGIVVIAIGGVVALIGGISCANAGFIGANVFEFLKYIGVCTVGSLLCWLGGEIMSLNSLIK